MILDVFLDAAKSSQQGAFLWHYIKPFMNTLFSEASDVSLKRTAILALSYTSWDTGDSRDLVRAWVETVSAIPKEEEVAPSVVDALLQMARFNLLPPGNHGDVWSWLTLRPSLPPMCRGRDQGSHPDVMWQVRGLKDIEILKSYFLVVWSEWDHLWDSFTMCECIREEFSGVEANSHRADLLQRLDEVIGELDKGLAYLQRDKPYLPEWELRSGKGQYEELRKILKEIPEVPEIPTCMSSRLINLFDLLTPVDTHRISLNIRMCAPYAVSAADCSECSVVVPPPYTIRRFERLPLLSLSSDFLSPFSSPPKLLPHLRVVQRAGLFSCL